MFHFDDLSVTEFDLFWTLFKIALHSYRTLTILKPLPNLENLTNSTPEGILAKLKDFVVKFESCRINGTELSSELTNILSSIFSCQNSLLKQIKLEEDFQSIKDAVGSRYSSEHPPDFIFKADYTNVPQRVELFEQFKLQSGSSFFAFHGSKLENFYSIINNGLMVRGSSDQHLSSRRLLNPVEKMPLYGEGIYLSSEMSVALTFSRRGRTWNSNCSLGSDILCVAVVEVADKKAVTKHQNSSANYQNHSTAQGSFADLLNNKIPPEYVLITDPNTILLRYLLVFCERSPAAVEQQGVGRLHLPRTSTQNDSFIRSMLRRFYQLIRAYPVAAMVLSYGIILALISTFNSRLKGSGYD